MQSVNPGALLPAGRLSNRKSSRDLSNPPCPFRILNRDAFSYQYAEISLKMPLVGPVEVDEPSRIKDSYITSISIERPL